MSLAETALEERAESAEPQTEVNNSPATGEYLVESTGAPLYVPPGALITIKGDEIDGYYFWLEDQDLGPIHSLDNGDFEVRYQIGKSPARLQFRQAGTTPVYLFGVSTVFPPIPDVVPATPMEDPPVTGVWGAETRPPREEPYPAE